MAPAQQHEPMLLIAFVALLSFIPPLLVVPGFGAAGRPAALFSIALVVWWALETIRPRAESRVIVPLRWALYVYVLVFVAAVAAGLDRGLPPIELTALERTVLVLLGQVGIVVVAAQGLRTVDAVERVLTWAVGGAAVGVLVAIGQFTIGYDLAAEINLPGLVFNSEVAAIDARGGPGFARVRGFARHPIEYGVVLGMLLPIAIHLAVHVKRRSVARWSAVVLLAIGIPLSISRSAILALAVGLAVVATGWTWRQRLAALVASVVGGMAYMAITPGLLGTIKSLFTNLAVDDSVTGRTDDFGATAGLISARPWLGRGPGTFIPTEYRYIDNEYLITVLQMGWLGLGALVLVLVVALGTTAVLARRAESEKEGSLARALGAAVMVAVVVFATFDAMGFPIYSGLLVLIVGCIVALDRTRRMVHLVPDRCEANIREQTRAVRPPPMRDPGIAARSRT